MKKISVIGSFGLGQNLHDGQTVKTIELANLLSREEENIVYRIDTYGWKKSPLKLFREVLIASRRSDIIIVLPAQNSLKIIPKLVLLLKKQTTKVYYSVIGGWLPFIVSNNNRIKKILEHLNGIWVETHNMKKRLEELGINNVSVVPNFKDLKPINPSDLPLLEDMKLSFCIFSRIQKEKGVTLGIEALSKVRAKHKDVEILLDIYGPISDDYLEEFSSICQKYSEFVNYRGIVDANMSTNVLKNYSILLFPTLYKTEGIPGTIIDAYASGIPIISSKWENFDEIVVEGETGFGFELGNETDLIDLIDRIIINPNVLSCMKEKCLTKAEEFSPHNALIRIKELMEE